MTERKGWYEPNHYTIDTLKRYTGLPCYNCETTVGIENVALTRVLAHELVPEGCTRTIIVCKGCSTLVKGAPRTWEDVISFKKSKNPVYETKRKINMQLASDVSVLETEYLDLQEKVDELKKTIANLNIDLEKARLDAVLVYKEKRENAAVEILGSINTQLVELQNLYLALKDEVELVDSIRTNNIVCSICKKEQQSYDMGGNNYIKALSAYNTMCNNFTD